MIVSVAWGVTFAVVLPRRRTVRAGAVAGLTVAAVDLGLVGRHLERIAGLPLLPQLFDHVVYGTTVGVALRMHRRSGVGRPASRSGATASIAADHTLAK